VFGGTPDFLPPVVPVNAPSDQSEAERALGFPQLLGAVASITGLLSTTQGVPADESKQ